MRTAEFQCAGREQPQLVKRVQLQDGLAIRWHCDDGYWDTFVPEQPGIRHS